MNEEPCGDMQPVSDLALSQLDELSRKGWKEKAKSKMNKLDELKERYNIYFDNPDSAMKWKIKVADDYIKELQADLDEYKELNDNTAELNERLYKEIDRLNAEIENLKDKITHESAWTAGKINELEAEIALLKDNREIPLIII